MGIDLFGSDAVRMATPLLPSILITADHRILWAGLHRRDVREGTSRDAFNMTGCSLTPNES